MIKVQILEKYLNDYLNYFEDIDPQEADAGNSNGLQVKGKEKLNKICFGVTASLRFLKKCKENDADAVIVHHGFRYPETAQYDPIFQTRFKFLLDNDMSLFGYHFLLDSHPGIGNNAIILEKIGINNTKPYLHSGLPWGRQGTLAKAQPIEKIVDKCDEMFQQESRKYLFGNERIKKVAAISGGGTPSGKYVYDLMRKDIDLFITGEVKESTREMMREANLNLIAGGHYSTETFGVKELMGKVANKFGDKVEVEYIELWNEV